MNERHMSTAEAKRLQHIATQAERLLKSNLDTAQRLVMMIAQATKPGSTTTEIGIRARNEELITSIFSTIHAFRAVSRTALEIYNRGIDPKQQVEVTSGDDAA